MQHCCNAFNLTTIEVYATINKVRQKMLDIKGITMCFMQRVKAILHKGPCVRCASDALNRKVVFVRYCLNEM